MMDCLVSVIVPVYNVEDTLERCVNSIIEQTYKNIEIILIDDGSTDNSASICDKLAKTDDRIQVIHKKNGGLGSARNAGVRIANGQYIEFVDSDDWIELDTIEYCLSLIEKSSEGVIDIVQFSMIETDQYPALVSNSFDNIKLLTGDDKVYHLMYMSTKTDSYFSACRCIYSKRIIEAHTFVEGKVNEDIEWKYKVVRDCDTFIDSNQIKYFYYQSTGSITTEKLKRKDFDLYDAADRLRNLTLAEKDKRVRKLGEVKYARTSLSLLCKIAYYGIDDSLDKKKTVHQLQKELRSNLLLLVSSPIKMSRKGLAVMFSCNYTITEYMIRLAKRLIMK